MSKRLDPKKVASLMNKAMQENPSFQGNMTELCQFFEDAGVKIKNYWPTLKDYFEETSDGVYGFTFDEVTRKTKPIHYSFVEHALKVRRDYCKAHPVKQEAETQSDPTEDEINASITLLKSLGYRILRPIFEEI